jgi:hypothetical protein
VAYAYDSHCAGATLSDDVRVYLSSERVPLRELLSALAMESKVILDLGGREVVGTVEVPTVEGGLTVSQLWRIVNEQLAANSLAIVQRPGTAGLSLVPMGEAAGLARIEPNGLAGAHSGYVRVLYRAEAREARVLAMALSELMPKARTTVLPLESAGHVAVAGLRPDVEQALVALELLDGPRVELVTEEVPVTHVSPTVVAGRLEQIVQKQTPSGSRPAGWFFALPESGTILIGAPSTELLRWKELVARFDSAGALVTRHYVPRRFGVTDVAKLAGQVLGTDSPNYRLVTDELTGTLVVTASEAVHERMEALFTRLEGADYGPRQELRSFPVQHRNAKDLVEKLTRLLDPTARRVRRSVRLRGHRVETPPLAGRLLPRRRRAHL